MIDKNNLGFVANTELMWKVELSIKLEEKDWYDILTFPFRFVSATKLRYFQYRVVNKYLTTNVKRSKYKDISNKCTFGCMAAETVIHLLWECGKVQAIWKAFHIWLKRKCGLDLQINREHIILCSYQGPHKTAINIALLIIKQYIYAQKCENQFPTFIGALARVNEFQKIEKVIAIRNKRVVKHNKLRSLFIDN